jgi:hypothetical protein
MSRWEETAMAHVAFTNKRLPIAFPEIAFVAIAVTAHLHAAPVFYVSTQATGSPAPGLLNLTNIAPNSTGMLHIWVDTDVRLPGISLDLEGVGGALKFSGLSVPNPNWPGGPRWTFLDGPQQVTNSLVSHIGGASPGIGLSGYGIGPGTPDGPLVLLASVAYMTLGTPGAKSDLSLRVGDNGIADFTGAFAQVRFGTDTSPLINGDAFGSAGAVGSITLTESVGPNPPIIVPVQLGEVDRTTPISINLQSCQCPTIWSGLTSVAGNPAIAAALNSSGEFSWDPAGSKRGPKGNGVLYSWSATVANPGGSTIGLALTLMLIPEPTTAPLAGLALFGLLGILRHRSGSLDRDISLDAPTCFQFAASYAARNLSVTSCVSVGLLIQVRNGYNL